MHAATQAHQTSTEAADTAARVALAAAHAGMGPAQQAQEDARAARLRHTILDDMSGALGESRRSGSFLPEGTPLGAPDSSENSFSRSASTPGYDPIIAPRYVVQLRHISLNKHSGVGRQLAFQSLHPGEQPHESQPKRFLLGFLLSLGANHISPACQTMRHDI